MILVMLLLSIVLLSGCWDRYELQDLAIITAAAIDVVEDEQIRISVQIFIPRAITSGETGEDPSTGSTFVREGVGKSLAQAVADLQTNIPRKLFWGQCRIFIFGKELAEMGIQKEIDFLVRHPSPRGISNLYVSQEEAKRMLELIPPLERYSGEALRKLSQQEIGIDTTLKDVDVKLAGDSQSIALPIIKVLVSPEESRQGNQSIPVIDGTAVFQRDKMVGALNMEETSWLLWLIRTLKNGTISVMPKGNEEEVVMMPISGNVKFNPHISKNTWNMTFSLEVEANVIQNETLLNLHNENTVKQFEKEIEKVLKENLTQTMEKLQQEFHTDILDFGKRFHRKYPDEWKKVKNNWVEKYPEVNVTIHVNAKINKTGDIGPPAAIPRDWVEEQ
ncbi:Ger(x)C family spore germination protein [Ornithinibacillus californiensis]|uniref:Ger(x)C family spore germination protein n=1 Tax=Ornithinibacillus californiensis TaxID=161536 RepID=UPI001F22D989|nr:Ger(x)C family spore germination protein [Ornithinibacillus californiensis]